MLKVGDELGRYEIIAHLKSGGMATLYLARRRIPPDNRIFAIKVVHPHFLDDEDLVAMFEDEARLSLRIQHPNVVRIEEVGDVGGVHFLAMEYIHGCSVAQLLQALIRHRRRMSPELAVYIAMQVCEALDAAHSLRGDHGEPLNVVHRDVSPQNILLAHTGDLRLIDFGIAKSRARMHHSATGSSVRGKLRYMSPEHAKGRDVDQRTDIYALGIVLWEMLTMRPLFWGETDFDVLTKVQDPLVDPPSEYAPNISPALDDAVLIALSANREARPATALEFSKLLSRAAPIAGALDDEQIAELLHAVLGEEMHRVADRMPAFVSMELKFSHTRTSTMQEAHPILHEGALDALTGPQEYDDDVIKTFVGDPAALSGLDELLGAASVELVEEETSTTINALDLSEYIGKTVGKAKALGTGTAPTHISGLPEPEDPTEQMSHTALAAIKRGLAQRAVQVAIKARDEEEDLDTMTLDEGVSDLFQEGLASDSYDLDSKEIEIIGDIAPSADPGPGIADLQKHDEHDDDEDDVTLVADPMLPLDSRELSSGGHPALTSGASWRGIDPSHLDDAQFTPAGPTNPVVPPAVIPLADLGRDVPSAADYPDVGDGDEEPTEADRPLSEPFPPRSGSGDVPTSPQSPVAMDPSSSIRTPVPYTPSPFAPPPRRPGMHEDLRDTRSARRGVGDSDPPTMVNTAPPDFRLEDTNVGPGAGLEAGDRVALGAGIFVAIILLVGIAVFLLL